MNGKYVVIVFYVHVFEIHVLPAITSVTKTRVHVAVHLMKQVQVIHELMKSTASATLHKDCAISVSMGVDSPCCPLAADVTGESHKHSTARRFGEERPWKSRDILSA